MTNKKTVNGFLKHYFLGSYRRDVKERHSINSKITTGLIVAMFLTLARIFELYLIESGVPKIGALWAIFMLISGLTLIYSVISVYSHYMKI